MFQLSEVRNMNPPTPYKFLNSNYRCTEFLAMAERELSAFFNAVTHSFGSEQARLSAEDWVRELIEIDDLPASAREWRLITAKVSTRLASRGTTSSLSTQLINA
jgi:hypothetical protein